MQEYMQNLKECVIESYIGIVYCVKEGGDVTVLDQYINDIFQYLSVICAADLSYNLDYLKSVAALIGDLASLYDQKAYQLLAKEFIPRIIHVLDSSTVQDHKDTAKWVQVFVNRVLK